MAEIVHKSGYKATKTPCGLRIKDRNGKNLVSHTIINKDVTCKNCKRAMQS